MKSSTAIRPGSFCACRRAASRFPNAADRRYFWGRFLDAALAAAITLAIVTILLFLLALG